MTSKHREAEAAKAASDDDDEVVFVLNPDVLTPLLFENILTRIQAQTMIGLRVVSPAWKSSIDDPSIELLQYERGSESYLICSNENTFQQLVYWKSNIGLDKFCCLNVQELFGLIAPFTHYRGSCHGLLLFSNSSSLKPYIINAMRCEALPLPIPTLKKNVSLLGYGFALGFWNEKYKCLFWSEWLWEGVGDNDPEMITQVLTVGESRWRIVSNVSISGVSGRALCYGKYICWSDSIDSTTDGIRFRSFDLENDSFDVVVMPTSEGIDSSYLIDLKGDVCIVMMGAFEDHDVEITSLNNRHSYKINIGRLIDIGSVEVKVIGMVGDEIIFWANQNSTIFTYNIKTEDIVIHGEIPNWVVEDSSRSELHLEEFHTPKASIVSLSKFPGFRRIKTVITKDGCGCSWWNS